MYNNHYNTLGRTKIKYTSFDIYEDGVYKKSILNVSEEKAVNEWLGNYNKTIEPERVHAEPTPPEHTQWEAVSKWSGFDIYRIRTTYGTRKYAVDHGTTGYFVGQRFNSIKGAIKGIGPHWNDTY
jgi:hypothetical protein